MIANASESFYNGFSRPAYWGGVENKKNEPEMPCSASGEIFLGKPLYKRSKVCYSYAPEEERTAGQAPDVLDIPTSAPHVRGR